MKNTPMNRIRSLIAIVIATSACSSDPATPGGGGDTPTAPTNLTVVEGQTSLRITWVDRSSDEDFFRVELSRDDGVWELLINSGPNTTSTELTQFATEARYRFRVSACNVLGCSKPVERSIVTAQRPSVTITIARVVKTAADGVQIDALISQRVTGTVTTVLRKAGDPAILISRSQDWGPNLPTTVAFYFNSLDTSITYEAQSTLVMGPVTSQSGTRNFRLMDM